MLKGEATRHARNLYFTLLWEALQIEGKLQRAARRAHKIPQNGHVRPIHPNAPRIHGQTQLFRLFQVYARIIELRQAKSLRRQYAIQSRRVYRPGRAMTPPRASRYFVELLPIAFLPGRHSLNLYFLLRFFCPF